MGAEVYAALATGATDMGAIADAARPNVFAYAPGREAMRPFYDAGPDLGEWMRAQRERARRIVAISQADVEKAPNVTLKELPRMQLRTPAEQEAFLLRYAAQLSSEAVERGDPGIDDPIAVAPGFTATIRGAVRQRGESGAHPAVALVGGMGLRPEDLQEDATIEDLQRIAFHHHRASIAARRIGVDPAVVAARVRAERLPSAVIGDALAASGSSPAAAREAS